MFPAIRGLRWQFFALPRCQKMCFIPLRVTVTVIKPHQAQTFEQPTVKPKDPRLKDWMEAWPGAQPAMLAWAPRLSKGDRYALTYALCCRWNWISCRTRAEKKHRMHS